jgi:hypothetical protein
MSGRPIPPTRTSRRFSRSFAPRAAEAIAELGDAVRASLAAR